MMKPKIEEAMSKMDMDKMNASASREGGEVVSGAPAKDITLESVLKDFVSMKLHEKIDPLLEQAFQKIMGLVWGLVDGVVEAIKATTVAAVGSVPLVGGALAAAAGKGIDMLYTFVKDKINEAIGKLQELLGNKIINAIVNAVFKAGGFKPDASVAMQAGSAASSAVAHATKEQYSKAAAASAAASKTAEADIIADAHQEGDAESKEEEEDKQVEQEENAADDNAEEDDADEEGGS